MSLVFWVKCGVGDLCLVLDEIKRSWGPDYLSLLNHVNEFRFSSNCRVIKIKDKVELNLCGAK